MNTVASEESVAFLKLNVKTDYEIHYNKTDCNTKTSENKVLSTENYGDKSTSCLSSIRVNFSLASHFFFTS